VDFPYLTQVDLLPFAGPNASAGKQGTSAYAGFRTPKMFSSPQTAKGDNGMRIDYELELIVEHGWVLRRSAS